MNLVQTLTDQLNGTLKVGGDEGGYFKVSFERSKGMSQKNLEDIGGQK
jgi:two-component sensor histidine kinase